MRISEFMNHGSMKTQLYFVDKFSIFRFYIILVENLLKVFIVENTTNNTMFEMIKAYKRCFVFLIIFYFIKKRTRKSFFSIHRMIWNSYSILFIIIMIHWQFNKGWILTNILLFALSLKTYQESKQLQYLNVISLKFIFTFVHCFYETYLMKCRYQSSLCEFIVKTEYKSAFKSSWFNLSVEQL